MLIQSMLLATALMMAEPPAKVEENAWRLGLGFGSDLGLSLDGSSYEDDPSPKVGVRFVPRGSLFLYYDRLFVEARLGYQSDSSVVYVNINETHSDWIVDLALGYALWETENTTTLGLVRFGLNTRQRKYLWDNGYDIDETTKSFYVQLGLNKEYFVASFLSLGWELFVELSREYEITTDPTEYEPPGFFPMQDREPGDRRKVGAHFFVRGYMF